MLSEEIHEEIGEYKLDALLYVPVGQPTLKAWSEKVAKLERVARAAEEAWPFMFEDIPKKLNSKRARYERLYEALADLPEDALGG